MEEQGNTVETPESTPADPSAETKNTEGAGAGNGEHMIPKSRFDEVNTELRTLKTKLAEKEAAEQEAQEQALADQQEWKELAETRGTKLSELEGAQERLDKLSGVLSASLASEIAAWPDEVKALDPGEDAPIEDRIAWAEKARPVVAKLTSAPAPGNGPSPKPSGSGGVADKDAKSAFAREIRRMI